MWMLSFLAVIINNCYVKKVGAQYHQLQFLQPLFIAYPILKLIYHGCTLYVMSYCYKPTKLNSTFLRYLMMTQITCETIFWPLFYAFQYLTISGFGTIKFSVGSQETKTISLLICAAYITTSGYFVTVD
jgi:hypothetical protein